MENICLSHLQFILFYNNGEVMSQMSQLCQTSKDVKTHLARVIKAPGFSAVVTTFDDDGGVETTQTYHYPLVRC